MTDGQGSAFGDLVRTYRRRTLWTQEQLAARCGLSVRTIRNLERGAGRPRGDSVRLLADALDLTSPEYAQLTREALGPTSTLGPIASQLPADLADFTGRTAEVAAVTTELGRRSTAVPVVMLAGTPGVGKTALALHVAHRVAERFPDGRLYVDLRGTGSEPLEPAAALHRLLRALGVDGSAIPAGQDERAAAYRAVLAGRRVLVVLDDAGRTGQVRPLLPGLPGCAVLVTGRTRLPGLAGVRSIDVDVPDADEAVELLAEVAGRTRVASKPAAARAIVERCGRLPLAVRIVGARLAGRPNWPLDRLLRLLDDEAGRLDQLAAGDLGVRASLALSYRALPPPARRAFRLLGDAGVADFSSWLLAPLLDVSPAEAERLVDWLVDACLLDPVTRVGSDRYRFHELVRVFARECVRDEDPRARREARARLVGCWLALAETADARLPTNSDVVTVGSAERWRLPAEDTDDILADPVAWFGLERDNLVAAVRTAAAAGLSESAWELVGTLAAWIFMHSDLALYQAVCGPAAAACERAGNVRGDAALAVVDYMAGTVPRPTTPGRDRRARAALATFRRLEDRRGETSALCALAAAQHDDPAGMYRHGVQALQLARRIRQPERELVALQIVGRSAQMLRRLPEAVARYEQALMLARTLGATENEADLLWRLAQVAVQDGHRDHAIAVLEEALTLTRKIGNATGEASVLATLSETLFAAGHRAAAEARLAETLAAWPRADPRFTSERVQELVERFGATPADASSG